MIQYSSLLKVPLKHLLTLLKALKWWRKLRICLFWRSDIPLHYSLKLFSWLVISSLFVVQEWSCRNALVWCWVRGRSLAYNVPFRQILARLIHRCIQGFWFEYLIKVIKELTLSLKITCFSYEEVSLLICQNQDA